MSNIYVAKVGNFPGRLFPWEYPDQEREAVRELAKRSQRLFVELGSGSGGHMLARAELTPDATWIGFELRYKRAVRTLEKAQARSLERVHVVRADGRRPQEFFAPHSLDGFYVNFPDPWAKSRWEKHRMLCAELLSSVAVVLKPGAFLAVKTDHEGAYRDFFADAQVMVEKGFFEIAEVSEDLHKSSYVSENVLTEFERLFLYKQLPIYYLRLLLRP